MQTSYKEASLRIAKTVILSLPGVILPGKLCSGLCIHSRTLITVIVPVDGVAERLVHVDGDRVADAHEEVDEEAVLLLGDLLQGRHELRGEPEAPVRRRARHRRHVAVPVWGLRGWEACTFRNHGRL